MVFLPDSLAGPKLGSEMSKNDNEVLYYLSSNVELSC